MRRALCCPAFCARRCTRLAPGFTRISDSDDSDSEEDEDERKEAPKAPKPKPKAKGKSAAEKKADELKEKKKEWLKKRVLLPEDQADGDAGTVVQVER